MRGAGPRAGWHCAARAGAPGAGGERGLPGPHREGREEVPQEPQQGHLPRRRLGLGLDAEHWAEEDAAVREARVEVRGGEGEGAAHGRADEEDLRGRGRGGGFAGGGSGAVGPESLAVRSSSGERSEGLGRESASTDLSPPRTCSAKSLMS